MRRPLSMPIVIVFVIVIVILILIEKGTTDFTDEHGLGTSIQRFAPGEPTENSREAPSYLR